MVEHILCDTNWYVIHQLEKKKNKIKNKKIKIKNKLFLKFI
jgi:hypothetical protein